MERGGGDYMSWCIALEQTGNGVGLPHLPISGGRCWTCWRCWTAAENPQLPRWKAWKRFRAAVHAGFPALLHYVAGIPRI